MKGIGNFFDKFRNKALAQLEQYTVVIDVLKKHTNITFDVKDISILNGVATIKASAAFKNEIYIKKQAILKDLSQRLRGTVIYDIK